MHWEADEIGTQTEAGTLTGSDANRGRDSVKDGEDNRGEDGESGDLIQWESLLWDKDRSGSDHKTFNQILDDTIDNFSKSVAHHFSIFKPKKKTHADLIDEFKA